jgi:indolepyruvate ferredoxin oxidoreductase
LYNDAVAMTGGQPVGEREQGHSVVQIAQSMKAEGAQCITVVTDEPEKYHEVNLPKGVSVHHRDELDRIQRQMREIRGTTIIIYDQTCATEKRRRRKRGTMTDPAVRVVINPAVCEGCGDCGVQSNCLSVEPLETSLGRKRIINQSTCNKDLSCVKGFCPSFVTVVGGQLKKKSKAVKSPELPNWSLPNPATIELKQPWGIVVAGVGGTGVITIGQLLGMSAHLEGKGVVTQDAAGLAQKGGATWSHALIANKQSDISTTRVATASADLILACDPIVATHRETLDRVRKDRTHIALNLHATPTAGFVKNAAWADPSQQCVSQLSQIVDEAHVGAFDANQVSLKILGDSIYINPMILGYAWQKGWLPLSRDAILRAIELNQVAVKENQLAFEWGRCCAHDWQKVSELLQAEDTSHQHVIKWHEPKNWETLMQQRSEYLVKYQNLAYAKRYEEWVQRIATVEASFKKQVLTETVIQQLFRLMAYKDEYEVARLHSDEQFLETIKQQFEGAYQLQFHLAPPWLAKANVHGELQKRTYPSWMVFVFKLLKQFKFLRGTSLDILGYSSERKKERELLELYFQTLQTIWVSLQDISSLNSSEKANELWNAAVELAKQPAAIKGFGHVKNRKIQEIEPIWRDLLSKFAVHGVLEKSN